MSASLNGPIISSEFALIALILLAIVYYSVQYFSLELSACFVQLEEREREIAEREKQIGTSKPYRKAISQLRKQHFDKISRRRLHLAAAQIPQTNSMNSSSPPNSPMKTSLYAQLDGNQTKSVILPGSKNVKKSRHRRVGSGGSAINVKSIINRDRKQYDTESKTVDNHTQTDMNDLKKNDETDSGISTTKQSESVQKKNQESSESSEESDIDESNRETTSSSQVNDQAMANSMATSVMTGSNLSYDTEEMYDKNRVVHSDDDNLENLRRKVNELIIETASNIDSYSTNSSTNTIINKNNSLSQNCEATLNHGFSPNNADLNGFDSNKNIKGIKCNCEDDKKTCVDESIDDDLISGSDEDFRGGPKKFNHSLRMKR